MNRRRFLLTSIAGALAQPLAARAQQAAKVTSSVPIVFIGVGDPVGVRILNGAKPAALAIEQPTKFEFVINLKTAKSLRPDGSAVAAGAGGSGHRAVIA